MKKVTCRTPALKTHHIKIFTKMLKSANLVLRKSIVAAPLAVRPPAARTLHATRINMGVTGAAPVGSHTTNWSVDARSQGADKRQSAHMQVTDAFLLFPSVPITRHGLPNLGLNCRQSR